MSTALPLDRLIDPEHGLISREIFVSSELHAQELEKLFTRAWLFVGHESQIPNPGTSPYAREQGEPCGTP